MKRGRALTPRSSFDRNLLRIAQERLWEHVPAAVKYVAQVLMDEQRPDSVRLRAAEMLLERSIPTLQAARVVVDKPNAGDVDWAGIYRDVIEATRAKTAQGDEADDARIH